MIHHLSLLFIWLSRFSYCESDTIGKVCSYGDSTCGADQVCVNGRCECNPTQRRYWVGTKFGCRVCPTEYHRTPTRCYRYYLASKNQSEARADCRKNQADLYSWRDNSDENELLTASTSWNYNFAPNKHQFYTWSGGMVHHGQGSRTEYKITWFDPKGPTIRHPETNDALTARYCNEIMVANYRGAPEPTREIKNGEKENCVTTVFVPQAGSRGRICMADDFCSTRMSYICEFTEATLSGEYATLPMVTTTTRSSLGEDLDNKEPLVDENENENSGPSALESKNDSSSSSPLLFIVGIAVVVVIIGAVAYFVIRKRKQANGNLNVSPTHSVASSNVSGADMYGTA